MTDKSREDLLKLYHNTPSADFVGQVVHDVRGPLSGVISAAKLMDVFLDEEDEQTAEKLYELIHIILRCTDNIRTVLDAAVESDRLRHSGVPSDGD